MQVMTISELLTALDIKLEQDLQYRQALQSGGRFSSPGPEDGG